jgi:hypothetical protein
MVSLTIPTSVTSIGIAAIGGTNSLTTIIAPSSLSIPFTGCQQLITDTSYNSTNMKRYTLQVSSTVTISTTTISTYMYAGCPITSITIPTTVTTISSYAFYQSSLTSIVIPTNVVSIGIINY